MNKKHISISAWLWIMLLFSVSPSCFSGEPEKDVQLVYSGLHFLVPTGMKTIVSSEKDDMIIFSYAKKFLGFSQADDKKEVKPGCSEADLIRHLIPDIQTQDQCGDDGRRFKTMMMLDAKEHGIWKAGNMSAFFITYDDLSQPSHVYLLTGEKVIQIDSNFMGRASLKHVVSGYFSETSDGGGALPPYDLIVGNIRSTDISAAVEITGAKKLRTISSDDGRDGYLVYHITTRVMMAYKGKVEAGGSLAYDVFLEAGIHPPEVGDKQIVSLRKKGEKLVIPDAGYGFVYSEKLNGLFEKAAGSGG